MSRMIVSSRENGSRRVLHSGCKRDPQGRIITPTNQEAAKDLSIVAIVNKYRKLGIPLPQVGEELFTDLVGMPTDYAGVFALRERVADSFAQLPADVREWMHNDPSNLSRLMTREGQEELLRRFPHYKKLAASPPIHGVSGGTPEQASSKPKSAAKQSRQKESTQDSDDE